MRSITFEIDGLPRLIVTVKETADGGLDFELTVAGGVGDGNFAEATVAIAVVSPDAPFTDILMV